MRPLEDLQRLPPPPLPALQPLPQHPPRQPNGRGGVERERRRREEGVRAGGEVWAGGAAAAAAWGAACSASRGHRLHCRLAPSLHVCAQPPPLLRCHVRKPGRAQSAV
eukprot:3657556-Rhodomonas_salina.1